MGEKNEAGNMERNKNPICIKIFSGILYARISDARPSNSEKTILNLGFYAVKLSIKFEDKVMTYLGLRKCSSLLSIKGCLEMYDCKTKKAQM